VSVRSCAAPVDLADLILASSCSPPMTSRLMWKGHYVLDGGVVDNVPVCALDDAPGMTLVMLTRRYPALPDTPGRLYVQPSMKIPVSAWDYTNADGLQVAYDLGRRDGEAFLNGRRG
jgi:predicted acylesterase/phospholipase RssA